MEEKHARPLREDLITQACLEAYGSVRHDGYLADRALDFTLRHKKHLYASERRAVAERVYALLRRQRTVDFLLSKTSNKFNTLSASTQDLLRLAASRVLMGEDAYVVSRSVGLSPAEKTYLDGLPDAARELEAMPRKERYAIGASLPDVLAERFLAEFGDEAEVAAEAMNERAPLVIRVNQLKTTRGELKERLEKEGVSCRATRLSPWGLELETRMNAFALPSFQDGLFEIQDEGSQLLGMLVDPPPTKVIDACAGAGGKTLQLAPLMKNRGELFAFDIEEKRMEELKKRTRRAGVHNVRARLIPSDATADETISDLTEKADRVLVDAPCSGTGTLRRKPDARYRITEQWLTEHIERQKTLLERFAKLVKPGGRLIYGTCSVLREENEAVVEHFLKLHPNFQVRSVVEELGQELGAKVSRNGFLRLFTHKHGTDGFFGAILVKAK